MRKVADRNSLFIGDQHALMLSMSEEGFILVHKTWP